MKASGADLEKKISTSERGSSIRQENVTYRELQNFCFSPNIYGNGIMGDEAGGTWSTLGHPVIGCRVQVMKLRRELDAGVVKIFSQVRKKQSVRRMWRGFSWLTI